MSYDVSIADRDFNYTRNLSKLFHDHIEFNDVTGLQALDGLRGSEASPVLAGAWNAINGGMGKPKMEARYNAANGWGSLVGGLVFLGEITAACGEFPDEIIHVSA